MGQRNFLGLNATPAGLTATSTVCDWTTLALDACGTASPAQAARALAILHTSMYNAWAAYDDAARQTAHGVAIRLPRAERSAASKAAAMSHAAHLALTTLFPAQSGSFDARLATHGLATAADTPLNPSGIGRTQARAVLDARGEHDDVFAAQVRRLAEGAQLPAGGAKQGPHPVHWCRLGQEQAARMPDDGRAVLLLFTLANALADAFTAARIAGGADQAGTVCAGAAAEVLPCHAGTPGHELGRKVGALVADKARRYWQGKL